MMGTRAQSEVLGYILIFSIVVMSVTAVFASGIGTMEDHRDAATMDNAQRATLVFADSVDDITKRSAPSRAVELRLADRGIRVGGATEISIQHNGNPIYEETSRSMTYTTNDGSISYELGAVIREDEGGALMVREPSFKFSEDHIVLTPVNKSGSEGFSSSSSTVLVVADHQKTELEGVRDVSTGDDVTIRIDTTAKRAEAWDRYFDQYGDGNVLEPTSNNDVGTGTVEYRVRDVSSEPRMVVRSVTIDLRIEL
jgi:hypothetical protein